MKALLGWGIRGLVFAGLLGANVANALEQASLVVMLGKYNLLAADVGMIGYDPENTEYLEQARDMLDGISDDMAAWIETLPEAQRMVAEREWQELNVQLLGDGQYPGLFDGYDLNLDASQRVHYNALQDLLNKQDGIAEASLAPLQKLYLKISSAVAGYVALTANPFGSMAMSMNDDDLRLVTLAAEVDGLFDTLIKGEADPLRQQQLRRLQSKWQFVRGTIVKASDSAMPYIVRYQGRQILDDMAGLIVQ